MAERDIQKLDIKRQERQIQRTKNNIKILDDKIFKLEVNHVIFEIEGDFQVPSRYREKKNDLDEQLRNQKAQVKDDKEQMRQNRRRRNQRNASQEYEKRMSDKLPPIQNSSRRRRHKHNRKDKDKDRHRLPPIKNTKKGSAEFTATARHPPDY